MNVEGLIGLCCEFLSCGSSCGPGHNHLSVWRWDGGTWIVEWRWTTRGGYDYGASGDTLPAALEKALHRMVDGLGASDRTRRKLEASGARARLSRALTQDVIDTSVAELRNPPAQRPRMAFEMRCEPAETAPTRRRCACGAIALAEREFVVGHGIAFCDTMS